MPELTQVRTSLEVGFPEGGLPVRFEKFRGRTWRAVGAVAELPFEDEQFEVVMMDGKVVSRASVREAHRVLRPDGRLYFTVPEKTKSQDGYSLPDVYSLVREGFNIVDVERPAWWLFGRRGRTLTIRAQRKTWRMMSNSYRPYV